MPRIIPANSERGVALVMVLLLVAILAALTSEIVYESRVQIVLARNYQDHLRATYVAKAGVNMAKGILVHSHPFDDRSIFQNQFINLFRCECLSMTTDQTQSPNPTSNPETSGQPASTSQNSGAPAPDLEGCGLWKLAISYPIEEDLLDVSLTDEQSRLNLNALVKPSITAGEEGSREEPQKIFRRALRTLFLYQANRRGLTLTEVDADAILDRLVDWMDFGTAGGEFDSDLNTSFEDGDRIYSNKNGPLDTVDELRMIPGMTDDLFFAVRDYLTVYPRKKDLPLTFSSEVNTDLASQEVLLALICGVGTAEGMCKFEEVIPQVQEYLQAGISPEGFLQHRSNLPNLNTYQLLTRVAAFRYYRIVASGVTPGGVVATIQTVVRVNRNQKEVQTLYWSEE